MQAECDQQHETDPYAQKENFDILPCSMYNEYPKVGLRPGI